VVGKGDGCGGWSTLAEWRFIGARGDMVILRSRGWGACERGVIADVIVSLQVGRRAVGRAVRRVGSVPPHTCPCSF
jgi:hypothetical protein